MKKEEEKIELEEVRGEVVAPVDQRGRMEDLLPVRLVAVGDVRVLGQVGMEGELTRFYVGMWGMERDGEVEGVVFRAENFRLVFEMREGLIEREQMRPVGVEVLSLAEAEGKLVEAGVEYLKQKGMQVGTESILVRDPAGNWVEVVERKEI